MNEIERFDSAFYELLALNPNIPPGPTKIRDKMGLPPKNSIGGRLSKRRRELLKKEGFTQQYLGQRWYKKC